MQRKQGKENRVRALSLPVRHAIRRIRRADRLSTLEYERRYNLNQLQKFESVLDRHGLSLRGMSSILDFGCGVGRLTQYLPRLAPQAKVFGCDVDSWAVGEARRRCRTGHFYTSNRMPPLAFEDGQFDLIWSYSVFTHFPESNHESWLRELTQKLRPGGVMLHTIHSHEFVRRAATFSPEALIKYKIQAPVAEFIRSAGDYYYTLDSPLIPDFGLAIISKEYIATRWPTYTGLSLVDHVEGAIEVYPEGCQDIVMLA